MAQALREDMTEKREAKDMMLPKLAKEPMLPD